MGIHDRGYYREFQQDFSWKPGPSWSAVNTLIGINVAVFALDILSRGFGLPHGIMPLIAVNWSDFFHPIGWIRFLAYGFGHAPLEVNPFHIVFNMIVLWFFGRQVEDAIGKIRFLTMYLTSIVSCSVVATIYYRLLGDSGPALGASGGVATITIFFALSAPNQLIRLWGVLEMPAWVMGVGMVVMNLVGAISRSTGLNTISNTAYAAHLVGAALGYLFFRFGIPGGDWIQSIQNWNKRRKFRIVRAQEEKEHQVAENADEILDKVHREGYDSLSAKEKTLLEKYSRQIKDKKD